MNKKLVALFTSTVLLLLPIAMFADSASVSAPYATCWDTKVNLKKGAVGDNVRTLQSLLAKEGFAIDSSENGFYGKTTTVAVKSFQEKYKEDVLSPFGLRRGNGVFNVLARLKLAALYGCRVNSATQSNVSVSLAVNNLTLDSNGVSATFCNNGKNDLATAPFRIRLNGINRDFEEVGAQKAGACTTDTWQYATWGLAFDPGSTFTAVAIIDPFNVYKSSQLQFPLTGANTITVPALPGVHLSVRSVLLKTTGLQATFCNLGTDNLASFPVKVTLNGTSKIFDVPEAYSSGKCIPKTWTYNNWGLTYIQGTVYSATVTVDPDNFYKETNEFDNVASVIGTP